MAIAISGSPTSGTAGSSAAFVPLVSGATGSYWLQAFGTLPPGRAISADGLSVVGTYTANGTYQYVIRVTDSSGSTADLQVHEVVGSAGAASQLVTTDNLPSAILAAGGDPIARKGVKQRLALGLARGKLAPLMASGAPTISAGATTSTIATGTTYDVPTYPQLFTLLRATWASGGASFPARQYYVPLAVTGSTPGAGGANGDNGGSAPLIRFYSDAPKLEFMRAGAGSAFRLRVDGQYVAQGLQDASAPSGLVYTPIDWGGVRQTRLYEFEGQSSIFFGGVRVDKLSSVWPAPPADPLRIIVHGDSVIESGAGTTAAGNGGISEALSQLFDLPDCRGSGLGSTGYIAPTTPGRNQAILRVQRDVITPAPDVIIDMMGLNDSGLISNNSAILLPFVNAWLDAVQTALPNTLIFMVGPWQPGTAGNGSIAVRDAKQQACAGRKNVFFIDNISPSPWVFGTGNAGSLKGDGNADVITSSDGTHPTDFGHFYFAAVRIARAISGLLTIS